MRSPQVISHTTVYIHPPVLTKHKKPFLPQRKIWWFPGVIIQAKIGRTKKEVLPEFAWMAGKIFVWGRATCAAKYMTRAN
jgi:hypothetical protein